MDDTMPEMTVGERVTVDVRCNRRWWEVWKPREWTECREMYVHGVHSGEGVQVAMLSEVPPQ